MSYYHKGTINLVVDTTKITDEMLDQVHLIMEVELGCSETFEAKDFEGIPFYTTAIVAHMAGMNPESDLINRFMEIPCIKCVFLVEDSNSFGELSFMFDAKVSDEDAMNYKRLYIDRIIETLLRVREKPITTQPAAEVSFVRPEVRRKIYPIYRPGENDQFFLTDHTYADIDYTGKVGSVHPLAIRPDGTMAVSLLGLSESAEAMKAGEFDRTDTIGVGAKLKYIWLQIGDEQYGFDANRLHYSTDQPPASGFGGYNKDSWKLHMSYLAVLMRPMDREHNVTPALVKIEADLDIATGQLLITESSAVTNFIRSDAKDQLPSARVIGVAFDLEAVNHNRRPL